MYGVLHHRIMAILIFMCNYLRLMNEYAISYIMQIIVCAF